MSSKSVAVVGVTGAVGQEMLDVLEARDFPLIGIRPLASERSAGKTVQFKGEELPVEVLGQDSFSGIDLALFSAGASISREYAPLAVDSGAVVVDNSSAFRMDPEIPLVVPEVNSGAIAGHQGIIANPNCSTIIMVVALQPIQELSPLTRVVVSTYQAASGAGAKGMDALRRELAGEQLDDSPFPHRLAGNLVPRIDVVQDDGYTKEELKMTLETRKIMGLGQVPISATCVRVPVFIPSPSRSARRARSTSPRSARPLRRLPGSRLSMIRMTTATPRRCRRPTRMMSLSEGCGSIRMKPRPMIYGWSATRFARARR